MKKKNNSTRSHLIKGSHPQFYLLDLGDVLCCAVLMVGFLYLDCQGCNALHTMPDFTNGQVAPAARPDLQSKPVFGVGDPKYVVCFELESPTLLQLMLGCNTMDSRIAA